MREDVGAERECDFEFRPGETVRMADDAQHEAAALRFRDVLGRFATGVAVVTGTGEQGPVGLTVQGFVSVSLEPPLVLFTPARTSRSWPVIEDSGSFCVNLLAADQEDLAELMATRGADKFVGLEWTTSPVTGSPLLAGGLGYVDCRIEAVHDGGDHLVVLGRVVDLATARDDPPLLFFRGGYRPLA